jgi:hypothetical protein
MLDLEPLLLEQDDERLFVDHPESDGKKALASVNVRF